MGPGRLPGEGDSPQRILRYETQIDITWKRGRATEDFVAIIQIPLRVINHFSPVYLEKLNSTVNFVPDSVSGKGTLIIDFEFKDMIVHISLAGRQLNKSPNGGTIDERDRLVF